MKPEKAGPLKMSSELQDRLGQIPLIAYSMEKQESRLHSHGVECGDGWFALLHVLFDQLGEMHVPKLWVVQVQERFGELRIQLEGLRFYRKTSIPDRVERMLRETKEASSRICEACGSPGKREQSAPDGMWRTRCSRCRDAVG